jgi:rhamnogalacturonan endolyase
MHDRQYRLAIAWQNTAYNQPPHASFALDEALPLPPPPVIAVPPTQQ